MREYAYPLTAPTYLFVGKKPTAVLFGEERVVVKTWRGVYETIIKRCSSDPEHHETLLYLRSRVAGKVRRFLAESPDGMTRSLKVDEGLYAETHYGSATLMHILVERILKPVGFDVSVIRIVIK